MALTTAGAMLGGSIISGGAAIGGGILSNNSKKKAVKAQLAWEREKAQNQWQWTIEDMKKAGINPAYSTQTGANSAGSIGDNSYDFGTTAQGVARASEQALQAKAVDADVKLKDSQAQNVDANTDYTKGVKTKSTQTAIEKMQEETKEIAANTELIKANTENARLESDFIKANTTNIIEDSGLKGKNREKAEKELQILTKQEKFVSWKEVADIISKYGGVVRDIGLGIGGSKGRSTTINNAAGVGRVNSKRR